jgi:hypothetical protein
MNGTSISAPLDAAAAALLLDQHPSLTPQSVGAILTGTARDLDAPGPDAGTGYGMLDVAAALDAANAMEAGRHLVVVETPVPVSAQGTVLAAGGLVLAHSGAPDLPPAADVSIPVNVPPGAVRADLWLNWSGPGSLDATLVGPAGEAPFEPDGPGSVHLARPVTPGAYAVRARPGGVLPGSTYALEGDVVVRTERVVDVPAMLRGHNPFLPTGGFLVPQSGTARVLGIVSAQPVLVGAVCVGVACAIGAALRRRR